MLGSKPSDFASLSTPHYLYHNYSEREGIMTSWRAAIVNTQSLAKAADKIGFNDFLLLSKGEEKDRGKGRQYILANIFEAFLGALYLDRGLKKAKEFIKEFLLPELDRVIENGSWKASANVEIVSSNRNNKKFRYPLGFWLSLHYLFLTNF